MFFTKATNKFFVASRSFKSITSIEECAYLEGMDKTPVGIPW